MAKKEGSDVSVDHAAMGTMFWGGGGVTSVSYTGPQKHNFKLPLSHSGRPLI